MKPRMGSPDSFVIWAVWRRGVVQAFEQEHGAERQQQADDGGEGGVGGYARADRRIDRDGGFNLADVGVVLRRRKADLLVGLRVGVETLLVLNQVGLQAVALVFVRGVGAKRLDIGAGLLDLFIDPFHLRLQAVLRGRVTGGLGLLHLIREGERQAVGDQGGDLRVGVGDFDLDELGIAQHTSRYFRLKLLGCGAEGQHGDDFFEHRAFGDQLDVGGREALAGEQRVVVDGAL